jgi:predicted Fe-Mo cluster-binding NifX family protein
MKIAVPSTHPDLTGSVEGKLGTAAHLLVIETNDMSFEAVEGPPHASGPGAGVMAVSLVVNMGARVILVGHIASHIARALEKQGITVVTQITGPVNEAVTAYLASLPLSEASGADVSAASESDMANHPLPTQSPWVDALRKGLRQFYSLLPLLVGVVLLLGLLRGFVSQEKLFSLFPGSSILDALWGALLGSVLTGNAVNSYVIGKGLLIAGVGLCGVTALMLAWVSVGVIQLPAESAALGARFALVRNLAAFVMAVIMSLGVIVWQGGGI